MQLRKYHKNITWIRINFHTNCFFNQCVTKHLTIPNMYYSNLSYFTKSLKKKFPQNKVCICIDKRTAIRRGRVSWLGPIVTPWARSFICACAVQTTTSVRRGRGLTGECARFVARSAHARVIRSVNTHASDIFGAASEWLMWGALRPPRRRCWACVRLIPWRHQAGVNLNTGDFKAKR